MDNSRIQVHFFNNASTKCVENVEIVMQTFTFLRGLFTGLPEKVNKFGYSRRKRGNFRKNVIQIEVICIFPYFDMIIKKSSSFFQSRKHVVLKKGEFWIFYLKKTIIAQNKYNINIEKSMQSCRLLNIFHSFFMKLSIHHPVMRIILTRANYQE